MASALEQCRTAARSVQEAIANQATQQAKFEADMTTWVANSQAFATTKQAKIDRLRASKNTRTSESDYPPQTCGTCWHSWNPDIWNYRNNDCIGLGGAWEYRGDTTSKNDGCGLSSYKTICKIKASYLQGLIDANKAIDEEIKLEEGKTYANIIPVPNITDYVTPFTITVMCQDCSNNISLGGQTVASDLKQYNECVQNSLNELESKTPGTSGTTQPNTSGSTQPNTSGSTQQNAAGTTQPSGAMVGAVLIVLFIAFIIFVIVGLTLLK